VPILEDVLGSRVNIQILRYLAAIRGGLSGNEIATRLGLQQSSARQALERLVATHVVTRTDVGRSAAYELDRELAFSNAVLAPLFQSETRLRDDLIEALAHACGELGNDLECVVLFGSLARGDRDFRDADLLFVVAKKRDKAQLYDGIAEHFEPVRRRFGTPVSAVVVTEAELPSAKLASVIEAARRDGVLLFGSPTGVLQNVRARNSGGAEKS
jgi:predicted nucleotidyltransferase/DNA-binding MarR family transcriptional regulator